MDDLLGGHLSDDGVRVVVELLDELVVVSGTLAHEEAYQVAEVVPRPDLGDRQGHRRPAVDVELHCVPDVLRNVEEVLL